MSARSWGHAVRMLTDAERSHLAAMIARYGPRFYTCATRNCETSALYRTSYLYVTGRRGRISQAERLACATHAERFAKKHGCAMPEAPSQREFKTGGMVVSEFLQTQTRETVEGGSDGGT